MSAKVSFLSREVPAEGRRPVTAVQPAALLERGGRRVAFVVTDNVAKETAVQAGPALGDLVQVQSGLNAGDKVVLRPPDNLRDGARVKAAQK
jgi:mRNA-degrading endonuclease toxin of MazEF toxin-antitoxin module